MLPVREGTAYGDVCAGEAELKGGSFLEERLGVRWGYLGTQNGGNGSGRIPAACDIPVGQGHSCVTHLSLVTALGDACLGWNSADWFSNRESSFVALQVV